jgi:hypothetical protein
MVNFGSTMIIVSTDMKEKYFYQNSTFKQWKILDIILLTWCQHHKLVEHWGFFHNLKESNKVSYLVRWSKILNYLQNTYMALNTNQSINE